MAHDYERYQISIYPCSKFIAWDGLLKTVTPIFVRDNRYEKMNFRNVAFYFHWVYNFVTKHAQKTVRQIKQF